MPDNLTPAQRSYAMSRVKNRDTAPEVKVRSALHRRGLRFTKHVRSLPGTPDIVFSKTRVAVFIDGDFWHGFQFRRWENKLTPYWQAKIARNRQRDARTFRALRAMGWRAVRVWTHSVNKDLDGVVARIERLVVREH